MAAFAAHDEVHGWRKGMRWVKRVVLGLLALIVLAVVGVLVYIHTDYGRNKMRSIGNDQLANLFTGGGSIGKVEGTPFGDLVLKDVVINGPDRKPAITVKTLHVSVSIFDLVHRQVRLKEILAEDLDVAVKRDPDGSFQLARLLKPAKKEPAKDKVKTPHKTWMALIDQAKQMKTKIEAGLMPPAFGNPVPAPLTAAENKASSNR